MTGLPHSSSSLDSSLLHPLLLLRRWPERCPTIRHLTTRVSVVEEAGYLWRCVCGGLLSLCSGAIIVGSAIRTY
jgi:hypothetical protein